MKDLLCFGDSNTYGYDPESRLRYGFDERWTGILSRELLPYGIRVDEEGLCGRTTDFEDSCRPGRRGTDALPALLESYSPEAVIIMLGTNDCKSCFGNTPSTVTDGLKKLIGQVRDYSDNTKILLISPIHLASGVGEKGFDEEFDEDSVKLSRDLPSAYSELAESTGCQFMAASDYASPSAADREHLDRSGHRALAAAIFDKLKKEDFI